MVSSWSIRHLRKLTTVVVNLQLKSTYTTLNEWWLERVELKKEKSRWTTNRFVRFVCDLWTIELISLHVKLFVVSRGNRSSSAFPVKLFPLHNWTHSLDTAFHLITEEPSRIVGLWRANSDGRVNERSPLKSDMDRNWIRTSELNDGPHCPLIDLIFT